MDSQIKPHHNTFLIAAIIVAVLLVGAIVIAFLRGNEGKPIEPPKPLPITPLSQNPSQFLESSPKPTPVSTPPAVPDVIVNPVKKMPKTNPFETKTNPYKGYKNPFE